MNQTTRNLRTTKPQVSLGRPDASPSTPQQTESLQRLRAQADQRIQLGIKLLQAAQVYSTKQQDMFDQLKTQQQQLREEVQNDIASSLQTYDQWMAKFDQSFTAKLTSLEHKVDAMQKQWQTAQNRIVAVLRRVDQHLIKRQDPIALPPSKQKDQPHEQPPTRHDTAPLARNEPETSQATPEQTPTGHAAAKPPDMIYSNALRKLLDDKRADSGLVEE